MKKLIILANAFPYGTWEPYLADELPYLTDKFAVTIFSLMLRDEQIINCRPIPNNVKVYPIKFAAKWVYLLWMFRVLVDSNFYKELWHLIKIRHLNIHRILVLSVFLARTHYEKAKIIKQINQDPNFSPTDEVTIYAYRMNYQPYLGKLLSRWFKKGKVILVARGHGGDLYEEFSQNNYLPLRQLIIKAVNKVFLISANGYSYLSKRYPQYAKKYQVAYLGSPKSFPIRDSITLHSPLRITTCSTITEVKRLDLLVAAINQLHDLPVHWDHFGSGPLADELKRGCQNFSSNVTVAWHGHVDKSVVLEHYHAGKTDFLVNVSASEGVPVSMMEALSCSVPVLATNVGGVNEIITSDINGYLVNSDITARQLAEKLRMLSSMNLENYYTLCKNAYLTWDEKWNADKNYRKFVSELENLCK